MGCIFLGGLLAIVATAGKEWLKRENIDYENFDYGYSKRTYTAGLWEFCYKTYYDSYTICAPVNLVLTNTKSSIKGEYFFHVDIK